MNDDRAHFQSPASLEEQAAAWVLRQDRGLTAVEQDEFFQWLALDARHGEALARHRQNWERLNLLGQWRPEHSARPNRDLLAPPPTARPVLIFPRWMLAAAAALIVTTAIFVAWPRSAAPIERHAPLPIASIESRTLPDGSVVELNRGATIAVLFTPETRRVLLEEGEAHFTVTKNPARPFIVSARGVDVRAVGTAFNVRLGRQAVEVLVTEGEVRVNQADAAGQKFTVAPSLVQGERTVVPLARDAEQAQPQIAAVSAEEVDQLLAWQPRLLDFTSAPLRSVVAEFNRRNAPIHLVIVDSDLAETEVSASLRSDNVEGFIRLLEAGFNVEAGRTGDVIRLRRR
jgi:transmembrane sensor